MRGSLLELLAWEASRHVDGAKVRKGEVIVAHRSCSKAAQSTAPGAALSPNAMFYETIHPFVLKPPDLRLLLLASRNTLTATIQRTV